MYAIRSYYASKIVGTIRPGSMKLKEIYDDPNSTSDDGYITSSDCTVIGNANPVHTGGFNINARYHGFDLSAVFSWSLGNDIYNANKIQYTTARYPFYNMIDVMADGGSFVADLIMKNNAALQISGNSTATYISAGTARFIRNNFV